MKEELVQRLLDIGGCEAETEWARGYDDGVNEAIDVVEDYFKHEINSTNVEHPSHYNQNGTETIDVIKAGMSDEQFEGFLVGNILKYISRYKFKNGVEDLKKARFYLDRLIDVAESEEFKCSK